MKKNKQKWLEYHIKALKDNNVDYIEFEYWHYQLVTNIGFIDFYPTTGKWFIQKYQKWGVGFSNLLNELNCLQK